MSRLAPALAVLALVLVSVLASPPRLLTVTPPVYHDEYNVIAPAVALLDEGSLRMPLFDSTPVLERALGGRGEFRPGLGAGFHVALAGWFAAFGTGILQARAFVYVLGLVLVLEVLALGWRWWSPWVGVAAALAVVLDGTFWYASRQVRPETFTIACLLGAVGLLSLREGGRRRAWAPLAGVLAGAGLSGHPVGAAGLPVVAAFWAVSGARADRSTTARLVLPATMIVLAYGTFLFVHREGVMTNLRLHAEQRALGAAGVHDVVVREAVRYGEGYVSLHAQGLGHAVSRGAWIGWGLLVAALVRARWARPGADAGRVPVATMAVFAAAPALVMAGLGLLARDRNFLYLLNHLPWLALAGAAGLATAAALVVAATPRLVRPAGALAAGILALVAAVGVRDYRRETAPYREAPVMPYQEVEAILARHLPERALVIGSETAWLAARAARAEFVFGRHYVQHLPAYGRYPVHATFDGSHLTSYTFDLDLLGELSRAGADVFYVFDMWDWAWNVYAPFGRYAPTYRAAWEVLESHFTPVLRLYTRDRGWIVLFRYGRAPGPGSFAATVFVEGRPAAFGPEIPPRQPLAPGVEGHTGTPDTFAQWDLDPDAEYWLHAEVAVGASLVVPVWNGRTLRRFLDAPVAVPLDAIERGATGELRLVPYPPPGQIRVESVQLREVRYR